MNKKQKEQNKILKNIFLWFAAVVAVFILCYYLSNSMKFFEYEGIKFEQVKEGQLTLYKTVFPMYRNGTKVADYTFYLRTNPKEIGDVPFDGNLSIRKMVVFNPSDELNCKGDGIIAVANIVNNLYTYLDSKVIRDENAKCDNTGQKIYSLVKVSPGNTTEIRQIGDSCYEIIVSDCQILPATEKYMLEAFKKINFVLKENY